MPELMEEVRYDRQKKEEYEKLIKKLKQDVKEIKDEFNVIRSIKVSSSVGDDFESRVVRMQGCVDIVGLPENFKGDNLEAAVLNVFEVARVPMKKRDFYAIHRLRNTRVGIAKVCNGRDANAILRHKKKRRELSHEEKKNLKSQIYVNESLCPAYRRILDKCNTLLKKNMLMHFT